MGRGKRSPSSVLGLCIAGLALCGSRCIGPNTEPGGEILVTGVVCMDDGGTSPWADVEVWDEGGSRILDAAVTVNGDPLALTVSQHYHAFTLPISAGDPVLLWVIWGDLSVSADVTMPEKPVVTAPTAAAGAYDASKDITVTWDSLSPAPEEVQVSVADTFTVSGGYWSTTVDGTATSATIPAGTLKAGASVWVGVMAVNRTIGEGPHAGPGSTFSAAAASVSEDFTTQP